MKNNPSSGIPEFKPERKKKKISFQKLVANVKKRVALLAGIIIAVSHAKILAGVVTSASQTTAATVAATKTEVMIEKTTATATTALPTTIKPTEQETQTLAEGAPVLIMLAPLEATQPTTKATTATTKKTTTGTTKLIRNGIMK